MTHSRVSLLTLSCVSFVRDKTCRGSRRPIGCLKLQVIFHKRATNYRALLRKMTYKDKASYESSPPCVWQDSSRRCDVTMWTTPMTRRLIHVCRMWHSFLRCDMVMMDATWRMRTWRGSICCVVGMWQDVFMKCDMVMMDEWNLWMSHVTCAWMRWLIQVCHSYVTRLFHEMWHGHDGCDMTHAYVTWLIHGCNSYVTWLILCDMTHSYVTRLIHIWHYSFICDMTHAFV